MVTRGGDPGDALVVPGGPAYDSRLDHRDGTTQVLARFGLPFSPTETLALVLPAVRGCALAAPGPAVGGRLPARRRSRCSSAPVTACASTRRGRPGDSSPARCRLRPFPPQDVAGVSILKLNRAEAEAAAGDRLDREALLALGAPEVVVTMGADGVVAATAEGFWEVPGTGTGVYADPTGAGDCWTAAYLLGRSRGDHPAAAAAAAEVQTDRIYG